MQSLTKMSNLIGEDIPFSIELMQKHTIQTRKNNDCMFKIKMKSETVAKKRKKEI